MKVKETDPIWSQIHSCQLHYYPVELHRPVWSLVSLWLFEDGARSLSWDLVSKLLSRFLCSLDLTFSPGVSPLGGGPTFGLSNSINLNSNMVLPLLAGGWDMAFSLCEPPFSPPWGEEETTGHTAECGGQCRASHMVGLHSSLLPPPGRCIFLSSAVV